MRPGRRWVGGGGGFLLAISALLATGAFSPGEVYHRGGDLRAFAAIAGFALSALLESSVAGRTVRPISPSLALVIAGAARYLSTGDMRYTGASFLVVDYALLATMSLSWILGLVMAETIRAPEGGGLIRARRMGGRFLSAVGLAAAAGLIVSTAVVIAGYSGLFTPSGSAVWPAGLIAAFAAGIALRWLQEETPAAVTIVAAFPPMVSACLFLFTDFDPLEPQWFFSFLSIDPLLWTGCLGLSGLLGTRIAEFGLGRHR